MTEFEERLALLRQMRDLAKVWLAAERYMDASDRMYGSGKGKPDLLAISRDYCATLETLCRNPERCTETTATLRDKAREYRRQVRWATRRAKVQRVLAAVAKFLHFEDPHLDQEPLNFETADALAFGIVWSMVVSTFYLAQLASPR